MRMRLRWQGREYTLIVQHCMKQFGSKKPRLAYLTYVFIGLLCIVSLLVLARVLREVQRLRDAGLLSSRRNAIVRKNTTGVTAKLSTIAGWMTFRYVNKVFSLPPGYLQQELGIEDAKYPNIEIARYAKEVNKDSTVFVGEVRAAVSRYHAGVLNQ